jgi:surface antigen
MGLVALATAGAGGRVASAGGGGPAPVVYGYSYADRCPGAGLANVVDRFGMYACNCTSYVAWALTANRQRTGWFIRGAMNAWNWPHVAELAGLAVDESPAVGAVAVWPFVASPFGHVAYVTGLGPSGTIDVAEYNFPSTFGFQTFGFQTRLDVSADGAVFIHVPAQSPSARRGAGPLR